MKTISKIKNTASLLVNILETKRKHLRKQFTKYWTKSQPLLHKMEDALDDDTPDIHIAKKGRKQIDFDGKRHYSPMRWK